MDQYLEKNIKESTLLYSGLPSAMDLQQVVIRMKNLLKKKKKERKKAHTKNKTQLKSMHSQMLTFEMTVKW